MAGVDVVALREIQHAAFANVLMMYPAQHVLDQAFAQRAAGGLHAFDAEGFEHSPQHRQTAGEKPAARSEGNPGSFSLSIDLASSTASRSTERPSSVMSLVRRNQLAEDGLGRENRAGRANHGIPSGSPGNSARSGSSSCFAECHRRLELAVAQAPVGESADG